MYKINKIISVIPYSIVCEFNTGIKKKIEILPLLERHSHLNGIEKLKDKTTFEKVGIGEMGEIFWKNIIITNSNKKWNYDISPEYIFYNGKTVE